MACPFTNPKLMFQDFASVRKKEGFEYSETHGAYVVSRYDDIVQILDQPNLFSSLATVPELPPFLAELFAGKVPARGTLLGIDNPDHDRLRKSVSSFFVPRRLERFEPLIRKTAHELIDGFVEKGVVDIKSAFAILLPLRMIVALSGMEADRWEWVGRSLALFNKLSKAPDQSVEEQVQNVLVIHEYIAGLIQQRKHDRRDDLISHIWNERDNGLEMTDFEHLSMIPGLVFAGHETSTMVLSMGMAHLLHNNMWDDVSESDESRAQAVEELLRYESAITGMRRVATQDVDVGGQHLKAGDLLFVAHNSGSRDAHRFEDPDVIKPRRKPRAQHLGFGRGIHACVGAPLARLVLRTELSVLRERLPNLRLVTPYEDLHYDPVGFTRGVSEVLLGWDIPTHRSQVTRALAATQSTYIQGPQQITDTSVVVKDATLVADRVLKITLGINSNTSLPRWVPGSHIDLKVGTFGYRQYSLCSDPADPNNWSVAVLQEESSPSTKFVHDTVRAGKELSVRGPRNHFAFEAAESYVFVAGGIGITPLVSMLSAAHESGKPYRLIYLGRSRKEMAFADELSARYSNTTIWAKDERQTRLDLTNELKTVTKDSLIYCCGPEGLISAMEQICSLLLPSASTSILRTERFGNPNNLDAAENTEFTVTMAQSGRTLKVPKNRSLLDVLNENGAGILSTCSKGVCGTCEVKVLSGRPEHRDSVLTDDEKRINTTMMTCVSRCAGQQLALDLW